MWTTPKINRDPLLIPEVLLIFLKGKEGSMKRLCPQLPTYPCESCLNPALSQSGAPWTAQMYVQAQRLLVYVYPGFSFQSFAFDFHPTLSWRQPGIYKSLNEQANSRTTKEIKNNKPPQRGVREEQLERAERVGMCRKKLRCALPGTVIELPHPAKTDLNPAHWMAELTPILFFLYLFFLLSLFSDRERQEREEAGPMYKKM